jgi:flagellar L-ring protein precursor FlgH
MKTTGFARPQLMLILALIGLLPAIARPQSLWRDDASKSMFADKRATAVGDIITILVQENSTSTKNNETTTERSSSLSSAITSFLFSPSASGLMTKGGTLPSMAYNSDSKHDGKGSINNAENILASIAVRIVDVLPNNNLVIEGKRETSFSGEQQNIILHGVVRSDDVSSANTVYSYNVSDATIQIVSHGLVTDSQRKGWFTRYWDKFSPF